MEIDFKKYDEISKIEETLEKLIKFANISDYNLCILNNENQILLILTIITILYKQHILNEHIIEQIKTTNLKNILKITKENYKIEDIIEILDTALEEKDIIKAQFILNKLGKFINAQLKKYYSSKSKNYIFENMPLELVNQQKLIMELVELNPFAINQCMNYKPLSETEIIIYTIIEYYLLLGEEDYKQIKQLIIKNNNQKNIKNIILLILSNVYQEILDDKNETNLEIKTIIENEQLKNNQIVAHFIKNDEFSNKYLEYFIMYNIGIKKGRLEELSRKPSYEYVKKRGCLY